MHDALETVALCDAQEDVQRVERCGHCRVVAAIVATSDRLIV